MRDDDKMKTSGLNFKVEHTRRRASAARLKLVDSEPSSGPSVGSLNQGVVGDVVDEAAGWRGELLATVGLVGALNHCTIHTNDSARSVANDVNSSDNATSAEDVVGLGWWSRSRNWCRWHARVLSCKR